MRRLILALGLASLGALAAAQETPLDKKVTVKYDRLPLADVLKDLGGKAGVRFMHAAELPEGYGPVTYEAQDQEAGRVAAQVLRTRGLRLEKTSGDSVAIAKLDPLDEFQVKREELFEFAQKPSVSRQGDKTTISFAIQGWCDATVAIEDPQGRIIRHLASGVLGQYAPEPLVWNSKRQTLVWDGKNDQGVYIDDKDSLTVRVSLGLKPRFERTLFWEPKRRLGSWEEGLILINTPTPLIQARPEGVYVFEGRGLDRLQLFDHQGNYVRTIYPFAADKLRQVQGLDWFTFPQDGLKFPLRAGFAQATFLTSGSSRILPGGAHGGGPSTFGSAATAMAVEGNRIALLFTRLNRLSTDGTTGPWPLQGPVVSVPEPNPFLSTLGPVDVGPTSAAFSPDGCWLYLTGYVWGLGYNTLGQALYHKCVQGVTRVPLDGKEEMKLFAGKLSADAAGKGPGQFTDPVAVACDPEGRVYVADYMNDRLQVFSPDGRFLRAIPCVKPARVKVDPKTGEIYVFSWMLPTENFKRALSENAKLAVAATLVRLKSFDDPRRVASYSLPLGTKDRPYWKRCLDRLPFGGLEFCVELDFSTEPATLWVVDTPPERLDIEGGGIRLYALGEKESVELTDFSADAIKTLGKSRLPSFWRQRLYVNPKTGLLYLAEGHRGPLLKLFREMVEIDPETGRARLIQVPFDVEDMAFDHNGLLSMRDFLNVARYDPDTWREVPWDYGEQCNSMAANPNSPRRNAVLDAVVPGYSGTFLHQGGLSVSLRGNLIVSYYVTKDVPAPVTKRTDEKPASLDGNPTRHKPDANEPQWAKGRLYTPRFYAGRYYWGEVHVYDEHGKMLYDDAVPGVTELFGVALDRDDNVYVLATLRRVLDGKPYHNEKTGTLMKFKPKKGRVFCDSLRGNVPIPLRESDKPSRSPDASLYGANFWTEGGDWRYGGVGFCGKNVICSCWNCRFALDYFARSFVPEVDRCHVAVLDSNGNLILRVGQYGNIEDGKPLVAAGGPANPRSIGGDEVALFYAPYLATHTDRRLFIADPGNGRILSLKLGYHAEEKIPLRNVPDRKKQGTP
jgi:hypothetical protein